MDYELPEFEKRPQYLVLPYAKQIFTANFVRLIEYDDHHFRVIFKSTYFVLQDDNTEPTKSQWATLKKKMKRHNKGVFIYKDTGLVDCGFENSDSECYYIDFGYFLY